METARGGSGIGPWVVFAEKSIGETGRIQRAHASRGGVSREKGTPRRGKKRLTSRQKAGKGGHKGRGW